MILDTNAVSALADGQQALIGALGTSLVLSVPAVVIGEYEFGIAASRHRARYAAWLDSFVQVCDVLDIDRSTATHYAAIRRELKLRGRPIPSNDAWIAALARQYDLPVVSRDAHFDAVTELHRVTW